MSLSTLVLNCTLKPSPAESSSELIGAQILEELGTQDVTGEILRVVDLGVRFGVSADEGNGDGWPDIRARMLAADIFVLATPIWMGQPSSVCKMVIERLDAELSESDDEGRLLTYNKVAAIGVVGNEDGAHHVSAELCQALTDVGFTLAPNATTYWVGEAMGKVDYKDKHPSPEQTVSATHTLAVNVTHLARLLKSSGYPPSGD